MTSFCKISFFGFASNKKHWLNTLLLMEAHLLTLGVQPFCGHQKHLTLKKLNNVGVTSTIGIQIPDTRIPGTSVYWAFCVRYSDAVNELNIRLFSLVFRTPISDV